MLIGVGMQMLSHADDLRMTGSDDRFFSRWSGQQARELRARQRYSGARPPSVPRCRSWSPLFAALPSLPNRGEVMVMAGDMSLGSARRASTSSRRCVSPRSDAFSSLPTSARPSRRTLQRLDDVSKAAEDPVFRPPKPGIGVNLHIQRPPPAHRSDRAPKCHLWLQPEPSTADQELQSRDQAGAAGCRGRSQRLREVDSGASGFRSSISPGREKSCLTAASSGRDSRGGAAAVRYPPWTQEVVLFFASSVRDNITLWNPAIPDEAIVARDARRLHP